ncbi:MAG: ABC transporter ATP-binding protein [Bdellovibrio sp.]|nr:ABC transporter ATP-binding protein [Bdellovibrio sp.]
MSLDITNVVKSYRQGSEKLTILKDLNLKVETGEVVAIVGASGSGKSTFLSLVAGLDSYDSGEITINNQRLSGLTKKQMTHFRAETIGFVFQQFHLISHLTAFENLALPLQILDRQYDDQFILQELENVGLRSRAEHKPTEMSGGECQRLALARALITKPSLLLADEPSGNLDSETGQKVMSLFFAQVRKTKTTTLLVTHDLELAKMCDRKLILKQGQLCD